MSDTYGELRRYLGVTAFMTVDGVGTAHNQIEVKEGDLFWLPSTGGVLIDTVISGFIDPKLLRDSAVVSWATRDQYRQAVRDKRERECPANAPVIAKATPGVPEHLAPLVRLGVRFQSL